MKIRFTGLAAATALVAGGMLALGAAAASAQPPGEGGVLLMNGPAKMETIPACEVVDATLEWGTLERWRAYISGSIARGQWELTGDNLKYEVPNFIWSAGSGAVAVAGNPGEVAFTGQILFSGHEDLLRVQIANPALEIVDADTAYLLLDIAATNMEGEADVSGEQLRAVEFSVTGGVEASGPALTIKATKGTLTHDGATAFGGFYDAGEPVDDLVLTGTAQDGCQFEIAAAQQPEPTPEGEGAEDSEDLGTVTEGTEPEADQGAASPLPWIVGGVALAVIAAGIVSMVRGRNRE